MKICLRLAILGFFLLNISGCTVYEGYRQAKQSVDVTEQLKLPIEEVWMASLKAAEELEIDIDEKEFDGHKGLISGHKGKLDYIRIHVEQLDSELTLIGTSARTSVFPMTEGGFDKEFSQSIIDHIKDGLGIGN